MSFVSAVLLGLMCVHKTSECIIKTHILTYKYWSGNWDLPSLKLADDNNAAGLDFPLHQVVGAFQVYIYKKPQQYWCMESFQLMLVVISFSTIYYIMTIWDAFPFPRIFTRSGVFLWQIWPCCSRETCRRSLEYWSRKDIEYSELTELLWKYETQW